MKGHNVLTHCGSLWVLVEAYGLPFSPMIYGSYEALKRSSPDQVFGELFTRWRSCVCSYGYAPHGELRRQGSPCQLHGIEVLESLDGNQP